MACWRDQEIQENIRITKRKYQKINKSIKRLVKCQTLITQ